MRKNLLQIALVAIISLGLFWGPFLIKLNTWWGIDFGRGGMDVIVQNFDGLNFLVIAKSWYNPEAITQINTQFLTGNEPIYFAAHFPLFAGVISLFHLLVSLPNALLLSIIFSNVLLTVALYVFFARICKNPKLAMLLSTISLFLPARMLAVRSVGSNEPLFIAFILFSLTLALQKRYWASALSGALAVLTRSPGILLFAAYGLSWLFSREAWIAKTKQFLPYLLMPFALLSLFIFYGFQYHDPLAYFHSGDNLHLFFPPFQIFSNTASWIQDMWREDILYLYLLYGIGIAMVSERWEVIKKWGLVYGVTLLFVAHRDLARYALPIAPVALLGYSPLLARIPSKAWKIAAILLIPIYLYSWQFVLKNIQPVNDWSAFF